MRPLSTKKFRRWCREIRTLCPTDIPVRVRRVDRLPEDRTGDCTRRKDHWSIRIWSGLCAQATAEWLVHEWTHVLCDEDEIGQEADHSEDYWIMYGSVYRAFYGED